MFDFQKGGFSMDVILSSASHHAMLFAYLAKRTIDAFGEAGKAAVTAVNISR